MTVDVYTTDRLICSNLETLTQIARTDNSELKSRALEIFRSVDFDEDTESFLLRIAILFGLNQTVPDLLVNEAGLVNRGGAIKPCDSTFRQNPRFSKLRFSEKDRNVRSVLQVLVR